MELTESDAQEIFDYIIELLQKLQADDLVTGIEESRRLGVEEAVSVRNEMLVAAGSSRSELQQVGAIRRRPLTSLELLHLALERLDQRLTVLPAIAAAIRVRTGAATSWLVDREFVSFDRTPFLETAISALSPDGVGSVDVALTELRQKLPQFSPVRGRNG